MPAPAPTEHPAAPRVRSRGGARPETQQVPAQQGAAQQVPEQQGAVKPAALAAMACAVSLFALYMAGLAPGITWAHHGADGGDLLSAAVVNGVAHPPGYPLYTLLLQGWLWLGGRLAPASDLAWRGGLFSALCAAAAVGVTVWTLARMPLPAPASNPAAGAAWRSVWAVAGGLLWGLAPLLWSQALITEVYTLHALGVALLAWAALTPGHPARLLPATLLAAAHHPTLLLLLPAAFYAAAFVTPARAAANPPTAPRRVAGWMALGLTLGVLCHLRTPLVAGAAPAVNWGFADNWAGFWWLVSGAAYRGNLLQGGAGVMLLRLGAWLGTVAREVAWLGLLPLLVGLATLDAAAPRLRTVGLLWVVPLSLYTVAFYTRDNELNMLGASWMLALWVAVGLGRTAAWLGEQRPRRTPALQGALAGLVAAGLLLLAVVRAPALSLADESEARTFLQGAARVLAADPNAIVISRSDAETFALWYGTWATHELPPTLLPVNDALFQFDWYRRLQAVRNPGLAGADLSAQESVAANAGARPIYFAEALEWAAGGLVADPPLWRYEPAAAAAALPPARPPAD